MLSNVMPLITKVINASLQSGVMPETLKRAVVTPLIKKRDASQEDLSNYRPISNLSFLGKLIEKSAVKQIQEYATGNSLHNSLQSAYRPHHSLKRRFLKFRMTFSQLWINGRSHSCIAGIYLNLVTPSSTCDCMAVLNSSMDWEAQF